MRKIKVSTIQMDIKLGDLKSNLEKGLKLIEKAINRNSDVIVLPEMWPTGFAYSALKTYPPTYHKEILSIIGKLAYKGKTHVIAGSMCEIEDGKFFNTAFVVGPSGEVLGKYRKVHLFKELQEDKFFTPGYEATIIDSKIGTIGLAICYDIRSHPRLSHWLTILRARAIENQCFVVGTNRTGKMGKIEYFGHSVIFGPYGELLGEGKEKEEILTADIDLDRIVEIREMLPSLSERKPEAYGPTRAIQRKPLTEKLKLEEQKIYKEKEAEKIQKQASEEKLKSEEQKEEILEALKEIKKKPIKETLEQKKKKTINEGLLNTRLSLKETSQPMKPRS